MSIGIQLEQSHQPLTGTQPLPRKASGAQQTHVLSFQAYIITTPPPGCNYDLCTSRIIALRVSLQNSLFLTVKTNNVEN